MLVHSAILAIFLGLLLALQYALGSLEAPKVLDTIMREHLRANYAVEKIGAWQPTVFLSDPRFSWKVKLKGEPDLRALVADGKFASMHRDKCEVERAARMYPDDAATLAQATGIEVFVADLTLDHGSLCAPFYCDVSLVVGPGTAYVTVINF